MKLELHLLQNFPPSCLNRDDTNSPKDCEFGGVRRARISSQSLKRAIRQDFAQNARIASDSLAVRTKRIVGRVADLVQERDRKRDRRAAENVVEQLLATAGLGTKKEKGKDTLTQYLLFVPQRSITGLAQLVHDHWTQLEAAVSTTQEEKKVEEQPRSPTSGKHAKKAKSEGATAAIGEGLTQQVRALLFDSIKSPELALFGRMIADRPDENVDAACQVAHAISTHRVAMEFDFYTAVDDIKPKDNSGADMMGTIQFNSACFYRYSVCDLEQLARSLAGKTAADQLDQSDKKAASAAAKAWLEASVAAIPSARQNTFAAFTPPQLVLTATREKGAPLSLANAFVSPVRPGQAEGEDLVTRSAQSLNTHLAELTAMYGAKDVKFRQAAARKELQVNAAGATVESSFDALLKAVAEDLAAWEAKP